MNPNVNTPRCRDRGLAIKQFPSIRTGLRPVLIIALMFALGYSKEPWRIVRVDVDGMPDGLAVPDGVVLSVSVPYDTIVIRQSVYSLSRFLSENGYPYNKIATSIIPDVNDSSALTARFTVDPDERVCNGPPLVIGVDRRVWMYHRDLRLATGQLYNAADVDETVRRLSIRPYVREAVAGSPVVIEGSGQCLELAPDGGAEQTACPGGACRAAVTPFTVTLNRGMEIEGALGYEPGRDGEPGRMNGRLDLSFMNMLRRGENFTASYAGTRDIQRLSLAASYPWIFNLPLEAGGSAGLEIEDGGYGYMTGEFWGAAEINAKWKYGAAVRGSETVLPDTIGNQYRFYGMDIFMSLIQTPWERGKAVKELSLKTGSGVANREISYARSRMELAAGVHQPVRGAFAAAARLRAASLFTDEEYLPPAEQYRIGGHGSLRGYQEEEFAFRSAVYSQMEGLYYFNRAGAIYIFMDGGLGWTSSNQLTLSGSKEMLGYGIGLRFPSRAGALSVEWARNIKDRWNLGRVHVGVKTGI